MEAIIEDRLIECGITLNGDKPYDIRVNNPEFYSKVIKQQSLGVGEAYVEGMWDCDRLDELFFRICRSDIASKFNSKINSLLLTLKNSLINQQSQIKSKDVARVHYNLGNKLFEKMLGSSLAYTCGYWDNADSLDAAQFAKYELICKKLQLTKGDKVLEIACGLGGLAKYMAEKYECEIVAIDIAKEPVNYARHICQDLPVTIFECDYRDIDIYNSDGMQFDKVVSVGVLEHIGYKNYDTFLQICRDFIKEDGILMLHSIGRDSSVNYCDPWMDKYIFPHGMLPSLKQVSDAFEGKFVVEDLHNFSAHYDKTLMAWHENFIRHWYELKAQYNDKFYRMMNYYLLSCAGAFRARSLQLWEFVLTPNGVLNGYNNIR